MSTPEKQPFDAYFRDRLAGAQAEPPPGLLDAVLHERRRRRKGGAWPWWVLSGVFALLLGGLAVDQLRSGRFPAGHLVDATSPDPGEEATVLPVMATVNPSVQTSLDPIVEDAARPNGPPDVTASSAMSEATPAALDKHDQKDQQRSGTTDGTTAGPLEVTVSSAMGEARPRAQDKYDQKDQQRSGTSDRTTREDDPSTPGDQLVLESKTSVGSGTRALGVRPAEHAVSIPDNNVRLPGAIGRLGPLWPNASSIRAEETLVRPEPPPLYVLPRSSWWMGVSLSAFETRTRWRGTDGALAKALTDAEAEYTSWAPGLTIGRTWRSGWGVATGVALERSEQAFAYTDRRTEVSTEVVTYLVTLNTQVFVSNVDTLETITTEELNTAGVNRRTVLRIPLQGHWRRSAGRWTYGVNGGLAVEFTQAQNVLTLEPNADGRPTATVLNGSAAQERHPVMLLAGGGLDVGFLLHERWSIQGGPLYMGSVTPMQATGAAYARPTRWGLQFGLIHHLRERSR